MKRKIVAWVFCCIVFSLLAGCNPIGTVVEIYDDGGTNLPAGVVLPDNAVSLTLGEWYFDTTRFYEFGIEVRNHIYCYFLPDANTAYTVTFEALSAYSMSIKARRNNADGTLIFSDAGIYSSSITKNIPAYAEPSAVIFRIGSGYSTTPFKIKVDLASDSGGSDDSGGGTNLPEGVVLPDNAVSLEPGEWYSGNSNEQYCYFIASANSKYTVAFDVTSSFPVYWYAYRNTTSGTQMFCESGLTFSTTKDIAAYNDSSAVIFKITTNKAGNAQFKIKVDLASDSGGSDDSGGGTNLPEGVVLPDNAVSLTPGEWYSDTTRFYELGIEVRNHIYCYFLPDANTAYTVTFEALSAYSMSIKARRNNADGTLIFSEAGIYSSSITKNIPAYAAPSAVIFRIGGWDSTTPFKIKVE